MMDVCRICLAQGPDNDIEHLKLPKKETPKSYIEILLFCLNIQVAEDSKVTSKVCTKCFKKIITYYKFKALAMKNDTYLRSLETNIKEENDAEDNKFEGKISYTFEEDTMCENKKQEDSVDESTTMKLDSLDENVQVKLESLDESAQVKLDSLDDSAHLHDDDSDDELLSVIKMVKNENNEVVISENSKKENKKNYVKETMDNSLKESNENGAKQIVKRKKGRTKFTTKKHKGPLPLKKPEFCEVCGELTPNLKAHSKVHMREKRRNGKEIQCELCKKTFATACSYRKHNLYIHMGFSNKCHICGKGVRSLNSHIRMVHQQDQLPHQCTVCQRRFLRASYLDKHMSIHSKDKPYACDECGQRFTHRFCVDNHKKTVHEREKSHMCQFCSRSFFKKHSLIVHLRKHTKEKPYECPECGKCFSSTNGLKHHRLIHSDVKKYQCTVCDTKFSRLAYLRNHMITHTKEKRHPCKYCGVLFGRVDHKKRHEFTAHEKGLVHVP